jgi:hypothetical protein
MEEDACECTWDSLFLLGSRSFNCPDVEDAKLVSLEAPMRNCIMFEVA